MELFIQQLKTNAFQCLFTLMRILFGIGWLFAGVTKITEKRWYSEPGVFIKNYFILAIEKPNVPEFYKYFIQHFAMKHYLFFNYTIPVVQILIGILLIMGLFILPSVLFCLFMHINFILSGNMNLISLTLYTSAFGILFSLNRVYVLSLDRYLGIEKLFLLKRSVHINTIHSKQAQAS
ncbi:DoxX family membrane protein [Gottfriedia acidiceleris]|uniref:DoxX family membrane protein n=1 Tax=Gottfriedia acidiceleris TaxID=371036 RepID=UPI00101DFFD4|nr:DoxX family membrane protein [Gottfriedia acidiceleris]